MISENKKKQQKQQQQRKSQQPPLQQPQRPKEQPVKSATHTTPRQPTVYRRDVVSEQSQGTSEDKSHESPFEKLKELSRDFYKEIEKEFNDATNIDEKKAEMKKQLVEKAPIVTKQVEKPIVIEAKTVATRANQQTKQPARATQATRKRKDLIPSHSDDIMKGVIFAEIIGPPKSKR